MLSETQQKGEIAFLRSAIRATEKGMVLSRPTTDARYDAILDDGSRLIRVQVKYADHESTGATNSVLVDLRRKTSSASARYRVYLDGEIDLLLVYVPRVDKVLAFGSEHFHGRSGFAIRFAPTKNGQQKGVLMASDFVW